VEHMATIAEQKCADCGKTGELRMDNRGHNRCTFCWSTNVAPVRSKPAGKPAKAGGK